MEGNLVAGVRKLRSGTWQGWFTDADGKRQFHTLGRTASRRAVLQTVQELEITHKQIRLGVLPRPHPQPQALTRPIAEVIAEYLAWGQSQGGRGGRPMAAGHVRALRRHLMWWQQQLPL